MSERCATCDLEILDGEDHRYYPEGTPDWQAGEHHTTEYLCIARLRTALAEAQHLIATNREYERLGTLREAMRERDELKRTLRVVETALAEAQIRAALRGEGGEGG